MKLKNYFFLFVILSASLQAQVTPNNDQITVEVLEPIDVYVTEPMWSYPQVDPMSFPDKEYPRGGMLSSKRQNLADFLAMAGESPTSVDPLIQKGGFIRSSNPPIISFDGVFSNVSPPDPTGAVGPDHIVEMTNTVWAVFDKAGNIASGFPKNINDPLGSGSGDPIVVYDREADRWLISQKQEDVSFKIAVSTTSDPTGTYTVYTYNSTPYTDYPHYGVYGNSYILTGNFSTSGRFHAFNRQKMIDGDPTAEIVTLNLPNYTGGSFFACPQPAHSEGAGIASGPAPILWFQDDAWGGISTDHMKVWDFAVDWSNPGGATISTPVEIPLAAFDSFIAGTGGDPFANLAQPGTSQRIDALIYVMNFQTHRYDFGTHQSIVYNFVVEPVNNTKISGLRWGELRKVGGGDWELFQEGTFVDPTGNESVFMGGIGMDQEGNIALGYIKTGTSTFPSLYFTGRKDGDPLGMMTLGEEFIVAGVSSVTSNSRYGDYSQLARDPEDDLTFWFTAEYSGQPRKNRITAFKVSDILSIDELDTNLSELIITSEDNNLFELFLNTETTSDILRLSVYDITGKRVIYDTVEKENSSYYRKTIDMSPYSGGIYIVEVGNAKTKLTKKIIVN